MRSGPRNQEQVTREVEQWGVRYIGTRDALIAAGHVRADAVFPGARTDRHAKRNYRHEAADRAGNKVYLRRHGAYRFEVMCEREHTQMEAAEYARKEREFQEAMERHREAWDKAEREREAEKKRKAYPDVEKFRADQAGMADALVGGLETSCGGMFGWRLCEEDRARLVSLKAALVDLIQRARIVRDGEEAAPRLRLVKS